MRPGRVRCSGRRNRRGGGQSATLLWLLLTAGLEPKATAHDAIIFVMLTYSLIHCTLAAVLTALQAWRVSYGYVSEQASETLAEHIIEGFRM